MNRRVNKLSVALIIVLGAALIYFGFNYYIDGKYAEKLPALPNLEESSSSLKKYITTINSKTLEDPSAANIGELGMVYHANNFFKEAEVSYQLAIDRNPEEWKWSYYLGCIKRELGDSENSIKYFNDVLKVQPNLNIALYYLGNAYNQLGSYDKFEEIFQQLSKLDKNTLALKKTKRTSYFPISLYASLELANFYANNGKVEKAENQLKALISQEKSFGPAYRQLSIIYAKKENKKLSNYYSERSKDLEDYMPPADVLLDKLIFHSRSETYLLKQIEDAVRSNNLKWALELLNYSLKNVPESKYIVSKAVRLYLAMNMAGKTMPYLDKHLEWFKNDYKELIDIGKGLSNSGLKTSAKRYFLAAEKIENEKPETRSRLAGIFYDRLDMKEKAFQLMDSLLQQYPKEPAVIGGATALSLQKGDMKSADEFLVKLKKLDPKNPRINIFNAMIAERSGDTKKMISYYELAFKDAPDQAFIVRYLSDYYRKNKMWSKLSSLYEIALQASPNNPNLQEGFGSFLINCPDKNIQNPKKAKEYSERALINYKSDKWTKVIAGHSLALSYFQMNEKDQSIYFINEAITLARKSQLPPDFISRLEMELNRFQSDLQLK